MIRLRAGSATDVGLVRTNNQDAFLLADPLYAVADGMGGHAAGEVASAVAIQALERAFGPTESPLTAGRLVEATKAANRAVWDEAEANPEMRGMGTTLVAVALVAGPELAVVNIGDSRLYLLHEDTLRQVTTDHNLVAELVAEGRISPEEAEFHPRRNILTRSLGVEPQVSVDLFVESPVPGDRYLLCSDGLPREVTDDLMASVLRRLADPGEAARELVDEAKRRGGNDNITVVVVDVVGGSPTDATQAVPADDRDDGATTMLPASPARPGDTTAVPVVDLSSEDEADAEPDPPKQKKKHPRRIQARALNLRVVAFIVLVLIVLAAGASGVVWYARTGYFVGLKGQRIVIYQGRPGGVLWFQPTVAAVTDYTTADVLQVSWPELEVGQEEASLVAARTYVSNLVLLSAQARKNQAAPTTLPTTTTTTTTTTTPKPVFPTTVAGKT